MSWSSKELGQQGEHDRERSERESEEGVGYPGPLAFVKALASTEGERALGGFKQKNDNLTHILRGSLWLQL